MENVLWYVYIKGETGFYPTHGKVYAESKKEAMSKMLLMAEEERETLQNKEPWSDVRTLLRSNRMWVYKANECSEGGYDDRTITSYRVSYEKVPR